MVGQKSLKTWIKLPFPFESFFNFYIFEDFSKNHNYLKWMEFCKLEKLEIYKEIELKNEQLKYLYKTVFSLKFYDIIPQFVIFRKKSNTNLKQRWYALESIFEENMNKIQVKFLFSSSVKEDIKEGIKNWILFMCDNI